MVTRGECGLCLTHHDFWHILSVTMTTSNIFRTVAGYLFVFFASVIWPMIQTHIDNMEAEM